MIPRMSHLMAADQVKNVAESIDRLEGAVARVIRGKPQAIHNCVLALLARIGVGGGTGHVFEYTGSAVGSPLP